MVVVFRNGSDEVGGKSVLLVNEIDGVVLLVPDAKSMRMAYPKQVTAVLVDGEHVGFLETGGFGVDVVGLGFGVDDDKPAFACYIQMPVIVIVHIPYKELSRTIQDGVEYSSFRMQPLYISSHRTYPDVSVFVYFYGIYIVFEQLAVAGCVLSDLPFQIAEQPFLERADPQTALGVNG